MSYILAVNPLILGDAGMDKAAVFSATVIAAAVARIQSLAWEHPYATSMALKGQKKILSLESE